eukprot:TRINITY_DN2606_c1_g1_i1.p1 TRINITY_DN2606_c1_g1~~TRINITY_DN2606_c1_g1_i1.p1  ORF type:complete len:581 (+),score=133.04 TRINITY_DN2606_c1_g1_i1:47-1744(+)
MESDSFNEQPPKAEEEAEEVKEEEKEEQEEATPVTEETLKEAAAMEVPEVETKHSDPVHNETVEDEKRQMMPEANAFYTDSALFLPLEKDTLKFEILRTFCQDNVWYYEITIVSTLPLYVSSGCNTEKIVKKCPFRYSRMEWLRTAMAHVYPSVIIPPVPPKDISHTADKLVGFMGGVEEEECPPLLVLERKRELEYFLNYLASHPALRESTLLRDFLYCQESEFPAFKDRVTQQYQSQALSFSDTTRNMSYKTKSAFGWLKAKVSKKDTTKEQAQIAEYQPLVVWMKQMHKMVDDIRAKLEVLYLQKISRTDEKFPFHGTLPASEWSARQMRPEYVKKGTKVQSRQGHFGMAMWTGKLPKSSDELTVGVEWDDGLLGNCDGDHNGVKYFQCNKKNSGSFMNVKDLVIPLPRDSVVDALDSTLVVVNNMLRTLRIDQERRLFYMLSDLQIARGWLEALQKCIDHLTTENLTQLSIKEELRAAENSKKEDVSGELELKDRLEKLLSHIEAERKTFKAETDRLRSTYSALWRGILSNYCHYNKYCEIRPGIDTSILNAASGIETPWE